MDLSGHTMNLGWGGFWFWDPVENASLLPWVCNDCPSSLFISFRKKKHTLFLVNYSLFVNIYFKRYRNIFGEIWNTQFSSHLCKRSIERYIYFNIFKFNDYSFNIFLFKKYKPTNNYLNSNSKETFVLINNWFMMFYLITVLLGTLYPIFTDALFNSKISVGPPFYNSVIIPVVIMFLFFMAVGPQVKWIKNKFSNIKSYLLIIIRSIINKFFNFLFF